MTPTAERHAGSRTAAPLSENEKRLVDYFSQLVREKIDSLAQGLDQMLPVELAKQAVQEVQESLVRSSDAVSGPDRLPVSKLKVSEVLEQGWVDLSQASLYRAVEQGRFYCTTPLGRSIGREFPAWQFIAPVPELIPPVLTLLDGKPSSEVHIFWICAADELNELSPAEVMAGKPFESRDALHSSQQALLSLPTYVRVRRVSDLAKWRNQGVPENTG
ncbi:hypothetical protein [Massilia eburnea]|uniref:hypothetical protein n=1 Tax=Massilia eburnea TaxID=1776165 RepID=UPI003D6ADEEC